MRQTSQPQPKESFSLARNSRHDRSSASRSPFPRAEFETPHQTTRPPSSQTVSPIISHASSLTSPALVCTQVGTSGTSTPSRSTVLRTSSFDPNYSDPFLSFDSQEIDWSGLGIFDDPIFPITPPPSTFAGVSLPKNPTASDCLDYSLADNQQEILNAQSAIVTGFNALNQPRELTPPLDPGKPRTPTHAS